MLMKRFKVTGLLLLITLLVVPGFTLAAGAEGDWTQLDPGDQHWYTLEYTGHHDFEEADDEDEEDKAIWISSNIDVRMDVQPDGGAIFRIITPEQLAAWVAGEDLESCGCGTENDYDPSDASWSGGFGEPGTYYLLINYTGNGTDPVFYSLNISGQDVTYEAPQAGAEEAAKPRTGEAVADEAAVSVVTGGTGPGDAMTPNDEWLSLPAGGTLWYAFNYGSPRQYRGLAAYCPASPALVPGLASDATAALAACAEPYTIGCLDARQIKEEFGIPGCQVGPLICEQARSPGSGPARMWAFSIPQHGGNTPLWACLFLKWRGLSRHPALGKCDCK